MVLVEEIKTIIKGGNEKMKLIIDTKSDEKHYVVLKEDGTQFCLIAKSNNTLDDVKRFIGTMNIKEVI